MPKRKKKPKSGKKSSASLPKKSCSKKGCKAKKGIKEASNGKLYCPAHNPDTAEKQRKANSRGGKKGVITRRAKNLINIHFDGDKTSTIKALVELGNFVGEGLKKTDRAGQKLLLAILKTTNELTEVKTGEEQKKDAVAEIVNSGLPPAVKLSKLVDIVGPADAMKVVPVETLRDDYADQVLDGEELLAGKGPATISKPPGWEAKELDDTSDVPDVQVDAPDLDPETGQPKIELSAPPDEKGDEGSSTHLEPKKPESPEEREARIKREAKELMGIYKHKVSGIFRPLEVIGKVFYDALQEGLPYNALKKAAMFPKSNTAQPEMMVADVRKSMKDSA